MDQSGAEARRGWTGRATQTRLDRRLAISQGRGQAGEPCIPCAVPLEAPTAGEVALGQVVRYRGTCRGPAGQFSGTRTLSLDPPTIPGGAFLARFLPEEFSLVNRGVVALPPALCAACP